jgi:hypothetical protein
MEMENRGRYTGTTVILDMGCVEAHIAEHIFIISSIAIDLVPVSISTS